MSQRRYRRPGSPVGSNRSLGTPLRSSTGTLGYPPYDPYYPPSRISRDVRPSPRSSLDRFPESQGSAPRAYPADLPPPPSHYPPAYQRPRRATLDRELQPRRPIVTTGPPPSGHPSRLGDSNGALVRTVDSDADDDYYLVPGTSSRRHQRNVSADERDQDPRYPRRARGDPSQGRLVESGGYASPTGHARRQVYQYAAPDVRPVNDDPRYRYGYEGYQGMPRSRTARDDPYVDPPPRRRRADSLDTSRKPRPMSMSMVELGEQLPRVPGPRDAGPPPSTRGFDRLPPPPTMVASPTSYEPPRSQREADFSRDDRRYSRGQPVLLHQEHGGAHGRHRVDREDYRSDDDRGHRSHHHHHQPHHSVDVDPRVALAAVAAQRAHRTRDSSPDDLPDGESTDGEARHRRHHHHSERRSGRRHRHHDATESGSDSTAPTRGSRDDDRRRRRHHRDRTGHESSRRGHTLPTPAELRAQEEYRHRAEPAAIVAQEAAAALAVNGAEHRSRRDEPRDEGREPEREKRERRRSRRHEVESSDDEDDDRNEESRSHRASHRRAREQEPDMVRTGDIVDLRDRNGAGDDTRRTSHGSEVRVVSPPRSKEPKGPLKGILREPRERFPEDPAPVREGVAPLKEALKDGRKGIPPGARWTKIDRRRVNPAALEEAKERFEERSDHVIVLRVLTREEIEALAARTQKIRNARERRERRTSKDDDKGDHSSHDRRDSGSSSAAGGPTSDSDKDIIYEREAVPTQTPE